MVHGVCMLLWKKLSQWGEWVLILALTTTSRGSRKSSLTSPGLIFLIIETEVFTFFSFIFSFFKPFLSFSLILKSTLSYWPAENLMVPALRRCSISWSCNHRIGVCRPEREPHLQLCTPHLLHFSFTLPSSSLVYRLLPWRQGTFLIGGQEWFRLGSKTSPVCFSIWWESLGAGVEWDHISRLWLTELLDSFLNQGLSFC